MSEYPERKTPTERLPWLAGGLCAMVIAAQLLGPHFKEETHDLMQLDGGGQLTFYGPRAGTDGWCESRGDEARRRGFYAYSCAPDSTEHVVQTGTAPKDQYIGTLFGPMKVRHQ